MSEIIANACCPPAQVRAQEFIDTLLENGECCVNYVLGASYHFELIDGAIYKDCGLSFMFCGFIDAGFEDYVDLSGVSSIN